MVEGEKKALITFRQHNEELCTANFFLIFQTGVRSSPKDVCRLTFICMSATQIFPTETTLRCTWRRRRRRRHRRCVLRGVAFNKSLALELRARKDLQTVCFGSSIFGRIVAVDDLFPKDDEVWRGRQRKDGCALNYVRFCDESSSFFLLILPLEARSTCVQGGEGGVC